MSSPFRNVLVSVMSPRRVHSLLRWGYKDVSLRSLSTINSLSRPITILLDPSRSHNTPRHPRRTMTMTSSTPLSPTATYPPTSTSTSTSTPHGSPLVHCFFDDPTSTWTYLVVDSTTNEALVIDPVLEYDPTSGTIGTQSVRDLVSFINGQGYKVSKIIETHVHADHATGARALKSVSPISPKKSQKAMACRQGKG